MLVHLAPYIATLFRQRRITAVVSNLPEGVRILKMNDQLTIKYSTINQRIAAAIIPMKKSHADRC